MTDRTVSDLGPTSVLPLGGFVEPRIEPEIVFGFAARARRRHGRRGDARLRGMGGARLRDRAVDFSELEIHAGRHRRRQRACTARCSSANATRSRPRKADWLRELPTFEIDLYCNGTLADRGRASNVLDGPVSALRHLVQLLAQDPLSPPLAAGEIVTTGTLTRALPIKAGETWSTTLRGIPLDGLSLRFA